MRSQFLFGRFLSSIQVGWVRLDSPCEIGLVVVSDALLYLHSPRASPTPTPSLSAGSPPPPPSHAPACVADLRRRWHILVDGDDVPPPIPSFREMRISDPVLRKIREKGIVRPTPI
uniref:DEAD-box RNA helicase Q domain-containing protein n=1 Tax=Ananas comosus var. bracteatus TaxID=296719 RepID=A0A6V7NWP4_ANACO|nr:unnamed protein product [Ananas comosus var. bracteatus]